MISNMDVIFLLRKKQRKKRINITVYCRVTTSGPRAEFSTGIKLKDCDLWDEALGAFNKNEPLGIIHNQTLNVIQSELEAIKLNLHLQKLPYGPDTIINIYRGEAMPKTTFLRACAEYMKERESLLEKEELTLGTIIKDGLYIKHIAEFLTETKRYALLPQEFKIKVGVDFKVWLNSSKSNTSKHLEFYKRVLDSCIVSEYISFNPLTAMKTGRSKDKEVISLDKNEIEKMLKEKFVVPILQHCAHLFLFQCGNGFSYGDLYSDKYEIVTKGENAYFDGERHKGDEDYFVPVFPLSQTILSLYNGQLPFVENRTYNRCLKQLAPMLGITKHLTTHTARKTFADIKDNEGWSLEAISRMLGHSSIKTTERFYIRKSNKRVIAEFQRMGAA